MADILQRQYCGVFSDPDNPSKELPPKVDNIPLNGISDIEFEEQDVIQAIDDIRLGAGTSEHGIPAVLLKQCKLQLSYPIWKIWKKSIDTRLVPGVLKEQYIAPIFKKGEKTDPALTCPIIFMKALLFWSNLS